VAAQYSVDDLLRVMERLRDPRSGCPWDLKQDFASIVPSTLEECYELAHAIEQGDFPHVREELGDVLFQVIFYAQLGDEAGYFDFGGIVHTLVDKLLRRHPHVFADGEIEGVVDEPVDSDTVKASWERIKQAERRRGGRHGALDDVPQALPAVPRAAKLQKRAAGTGFDWTHREAVLGQVLRELDELREAMGRDSAEDMEDELGDVLFSVINLSRHLGIDAERALRRTNRKFERRFRAMEEAAAQQGVELSAIVMDEKEALWSRAKKRLAPRR